MERRQQYNMVTLISGLVCALTYVVVFDIRLWWILHLHQPLLQCKLSYIGPKVRFYCDSAQHQGWCGVWWRVALSWLPRQEGPLFRPVIFPDLLPSLFQIEKLFRRFHLRDVSLDAHLHITQVITDRFIVNTSCKTNMLLRGKLWLMVHQMEVRDRHVNLRQNCCLSSHVQGCLWQPALIVHLKVHLDVL